MTVDYDSMSRPNVILHTLHYSLKYNTGYHAPMTEYDNNLSWYGIVTSLNARRFVNKAFRKQVGMFRKRFHSSLDLLQCYRELGSRSISKSAAHNFLKKSTGF